MKKMRCRECATNCAIKERVISGEIGLGEVLEKTGIHVGKSAGDHYPIYCDDFKPEPKPKSKLDSDNISSVIQEFKKTLENHGLVVVDWNADTRITERDSKGMIILEVVPKWEYLKSEEKPENND
jgi:uncharacterized protein YktB (UPF0637 family)